MAPIDHLIVGYGFRGRRWNRLVRAIGGHRVVGAVDPSPEARRSAEDDGLRTWADLDEALAESPARAAIISSPHGHHATQGVACMEAGRAVLIEKPMARSLEEARPLVEAARRTAQPAIVTQTKRFIRREHVIGTLLRSGALGPLRTVTISLMYPPRPDGDSLDVADALDSELVHQLDALRIRFGMPSRIVPGTSSVEGLFRHGFVMTLEWGDGPTASCFYRRVGRVEHYHEMLEGEDAHAYVIRERVYLVRGRGRPRRIWFPRYTRPERILLDRLAEWLDGRPAPEVGVEENLQTVALLESAKLALASGDPVSPERVAGDALRAP